ncbi:MAG: DUF465 domain-containing protein [Deltaproteobacteria bacterium]|nr:DUF465 domain-containing protein [Deltaproteobacteria bacterium]
MGVGPVEERGMDIEQLRRLEDEHKDLERRLAELEKHRYLSPREQQERVTLKKLKLAKKDAIQRMSR